MNCWYCLGILLILLLHCCVESCPFGICSGKFSCRVPTWGLSARGHVQGLVAEFAGVEEVPRGVLVARAQLLGLVGGAGVLGGRRILGGVKKSSATQEIQHTLQDLAGMGVLSLVQGFGRDRVLRVPVIVTVLPRFRGCIRVTRLMNPWTGLGLGREFGVVRAHVSRLCMTRGSN